MAEQFEGTGYEVVPEALRDAEKAWDTAMINWEFFHLVVRDDLVMGAGDMGLLGREQNFPAAYNATCTEIVDKLKAGARTLEASRDELDAVAREYEAKDAEYYEKFGYLSSEELGS